jgi:hypothetical protein
MKFPSHVLLEINKLNLSNSTQHWIFKYVFFLKNKNVFNFNSIFINKKFLLNKQSLFLNKLTTNQLDYTIKYSTTSPLTFLNDNEKAFLLKAYSPRLKVNKRVFESKNFGKEVFDFSTTNNLKFNEKLIKILIKNFSINLNPSIFVSNLTWNLFDINFLRKERIYTKIKYTRVPHYDIVSGGAAALFAGFLGFLISEKFGFELVDSGDFYFLFMYLVFLFFFVRLFLKITDANESTWNPFSLKWLIYFYRNIFIIFLNWLTYVWSFFKKITFF